MSMTIGPRNLTGPSSVARAAGAAAILIGVLVLAGWTFDVAVLKSLIPGRTAMNPGGSALAFLLAGVSLWVQASEVMTSRRRAVGIACAVGVLLIGLARVGGYLAGWDVGPDQLLFREDLEREALRLGQPNRMAPNTAAAFALVGLALALLDVETRRGIRPAQLLALTGGLIALLVLIGYAYSAISLIGVRQFIPMALNSAIGFAVLSIGILHARPRPRADGGRHQPRRRRRHGAAAAARRRSSSPRPSGGWGGCWSSRGARPTRSWGCRSSSLANIVIFTALIWWDAASLNRMDRERRRAERRLGVQYTASCVLAESPQLADAVPKILEAVCESLGWEVGAMWRVDPEAGVLRCGDVWHAPVIRGGGIRGPDAGGPPSPPGSACPAASGRAASRPGSRTSSRTPTSRGLGPRPARACTAPSASRSSSAATSWASSRPSAARSSSPTRTCSRCWRPSAARSASSSSASRPRRRSSRSVTC